MGRNMKGGRLFGWCLLLFQTLISAWSVQIDSLSVPGTGSGMVVATTTTSTSLHAYCRLFLYLLESLAQNYQYWYRVCLMGYIEN